MTNSCATEFTVATRESDSILVAVERRCLVWMATRLPPWLNSDHLTGLAFLAMAAAGTAYWAARFNRSWLVAVVICLVLNWFGDSLDGTLARVRQQQRPRYGFYVDHVVDCFGVLFLLGGLALSGFMSPLIAMGVLITYFMLSIEIYLATYCLTVFRLSFWGMGPTELRLLLAIGALALTRDPHVEMWGRAFRLFDVGGAVAIVALATTLLVSVARNVRALYRAEPLPRRDRPNAPMLSSERSIGRRLLMFYIVGAGGVGLQLGCLWTLKELLAIDYLVATIIAVAMTVLHNFFWHGWWTWADRPATPSEVLRRLVRFNLTTGLISIAGNVVVTAALVRLGMDYLAANAVAIAVCSAVNFLVSHRVVFAPALCVFGIVSAAPATTQAADLSPAASAAFDGDARAIEARLDDERSGAAPFLWLDRLPVEERREGYARMSRGEVVVCRVRSGSECQTAGAMCHHWIATVLLKLTPLQRVVDLMQSYDRYQDVYRPAIRRSRTLARDGDHFVVDLQLFMKKIVSVTLNTQSDVAYRQVSGTRMQVRSRSTRIAEVRNASTAAEREEPVGHDSGFLWRFNNYCALEHRAEGTYVQCESLSLSRDIPLGLAWLIGSFVTSIPRESLEFTLQAMRVAVSGETVRGSGLPPQEHRDELASKLLSLGLSESVPVGD
jgi:archaetidylinositol phosphate synthase